MNKGLLLAKERVALKRALRWYRGAYFRGKADSDAVDAIQDLLRRDEVQKGEGEG